GLLERGVDARSDLYALGVLLYQCLAGRNPFHAQTLGEVLRRHLTLQPPSLRGQVAAIPRALDDLVLRLLQKDPRDRYQSAAAALVDLDELAEGRRRGTADPRLVVGARDRRDSLSEPAFVGREHELRVLDDLLLRATLGEGGLVLIRAESGGGKTRLLEELLQHGLQRGALVLRGRSTDHAASLPYQFMAGIANGLASVCRADLALAQRLRDRLGYDRAAVCEVFPELRDALDLQTSGAIGPEELGEQRAARALSSLLVAAGTPERPVLVLLDDLQWAGDHGAQVLERFARWRATAERGGTPVLVVGTYRAEEAPEGHWLRRVPAMLRLALAPLGPAEINSITESMAGPLPAEAAALVMRLSGGNPFVASALLRGLVETRALIGTEAGWTVDARAMHDVQASRMAGVLLARRMDQLPAETLRVFIAGAVLGKVFDLGDAAALSGQGWPEALRAIEAGRARHLVWSSAQAGSCSFVHDKIREALLARLSDAERKALHLEAARLFSSRAGDWSFELAFHFAEAGEHARAFPHALAAAEKARARNALETAIRYYRIADSGAAGSDDATRLRIVQSLGLLLGVRGRYDESIAELTRAAQFANTSADRAAILRTTGDIHFRSGNMEQAVIALEGALRQLGARPPSTQAGFLFGIVGQTLLQVLHSLFPRRFVARRPRAGAAQELAAARIFSQLVPPYFLQRGPLPTIWAQLRALNLAERHPPTPELAQAYVDHAIALSVLPWYSRALRYAQRGHEMAVELGDLHQAARVAHNRCIVLQFSGHHRESTELDRSILPVLERLGDAAWAWYARGTIAFNQMVMGHHREAMPILALAHEIDPPDLDAQNHAFWLEAYAKATNGQVSAEVIAAARKRCPSKNQQVCLMRAEGIRLLAGGRPLEASKAFEEAEELQRSAGLRGFYAGNSSAWLTTALRQAAEQTPAWASRERARLWGLAEAALRRALRISRSFQETLPHSLCELAYLEAYHGRPDEARAALDEALAVSSIRGARVDRGRVLWTRGQLGAVFGWQDSAEDLAAAKAEFADTASAPL
ncbi:MAG: AAA family ATPase, partial [Deltaproteobacteria bacterium]|nr:AAA family ATPase [Deltaproteobacteria bacterium]